MTAMQAERRRTVRRAGERERLEAGRMAEMAGVLAGVGYWRLDLVTGRPMWSDLMFEIYGRSPNRPVPTLEEMLSTYFPDNADEVRAQIRRAVAEGPTAGRLEFELTRECGEVRLVTGQSVLERDADGRPIAMFGTLMDVTEQRRAERAVRESEALYRLLAENATDMIARIDLEGSTLYVTPSTERVIGYPAAGLIGRKTLEFVHRDDGAALVAAYRRLMSGGPPERIEYRFRHRDGRWIWLEASPMLVRREDGEPEGFIDVARDVTARKALEAELVAARQEAEAAAEAKARFLANMSHELRTPVTAVIGFTDLLAASAGLDDAARRWVDRIASGGRALLATVNDVLDFSKLEAGRLAINPAPARPAAVVEDCAGLFEAQAEAKGLRVQVRGLEALPPCALVDADRLRQVLLNLVGNAVKFTERGEVTVSAAWDAARERMRLSVRDTGPGISRQVQARLFQRFSQVDGEAAPRQQGAGLGLAICKGLVEAMGGEIGVESSEGRGATFWFELPLPPARLPACDAEGAAAAPRPGARVLVVDDNPANRELVRAILEPFGCEVTEAGDGGAALNEAMLRPFDLILMDLRMPVCDGRQAARALRAAGGANAASAILAFSADGEADLRPGDDVLFDGRLAKPLRPAELLRRVAEACAPSARAPAAGAASA